MEKFPVMAVVCLLAILLECQAGVDDNQIQTSELTHEDVLDTRAEQETSQNSDRGLETPDTVQEMLQALEEKLTATVRALEETNKRLEASEQKLSTLDHSVAEFGVRYQGQPRVAFSAALPVDGTIGPANVLYPLVYKHVISNIGGHYSKITGYFIAPVRGAYYFTFTSHCWSVQNGKSCGGSLYHNENKIVSWYEFDPTHPSSAANSAILHLQAGDHVNVRLWKNGLISDNVNKYSTFNGFLLFPM